MTHGIVQGGFAELQGGDFGSSFLSGFTGSIAGSMITAKSGDESFFGAKNDGGKYLARRTVAAAVVGGTTSEIAGGKFANGAATAAMVHLLNHEGAHLVSREVKPIGTPTGGRHAAVSVDLTATEAAEINTFLTENDFPKLKQNRIVFSADKIGGKLFGMINNPADLTGSGNPLAAGIKFEQNLSFNSGVSKMAFVKDAILGTKNFNTHGIQYSYAAAGDLNLFTKGYNSNSYALGLTAYAGGSITTTRGLIHGFPGITQIVHRKFFAHPNQ